MTHNEELAYHRAARDFHASKVRELEASGGSAGVAPPMPNPAPPAPPALTAADVAARLAMHPNSVYQLFTRKHHSIPHLRTGKTGIRVQADTFEKWLREEEQMSVATSKARGRA
ncbi:hypothetical protein [Prescottella equi]|uniref:Helix-turn-helix domain-containing protein n=1 Tax=Rhodococcus phage REQ2 TaxID=1109713 RepID=G9FGY7_9CAUD|nr:hypothetical protein [Prescottella equi]YP_005087088.1 hypothetical protein RoPhREQ2_gp44 [Rhodococcus phage REQ2]AEV51898.1 hypothetical protein [Rhodococcus phage REQ2]